MPINGKKRWILEKEINEVKPVFVVEVPETGMPTKEEWKKQINHIGKVKDYDHHDILENGIDINESLVMKQIKKRAEDNYKKYPEKKGKLVIFHNNIESEESDGRPTDDS